MKPKTINDVFEKRAKDVQDNLKRDAARQAERDAELEKTRQTEQKRIRQCLPHIHDLRDKIIAGFGEHWNTKASREFEIDIQDTVLSIKWNENFSRYKWDIRVSLNGQKVAYESLGVKRHVSATTKSARDGEGGTTSVIDDNIPYGFIIDMIFDMERAGRSPQKQKRATIRMNANPGQRSVDEILETALEFSANHAQRMMTVRYSGRLRRFADLLGFNL